jgi:hypothetical protein
LIHTTDLSLPSHAFAQELLVMQQQNATRMQDGVQCPFSPAHPSAGQALASPSHCASKPYSPPPLTRRPLTPEEKSIFSANPITAIGKHFILDPDSSNPLAYKIAGVKASEEKVIYEVILGGCFHTEDLERQEVEDMMDSSDILE